MKFSSIIAKCSFFLPVIFGFSVKLLPINREDVENYVVAVFLGIFLQFLLCVGNLIYLNNKTMRKWDKLLSFLGVVPFLFLLILFALSRMASLQY